MGALDHTRIALFVTADATAGDCPLTKPKFAVLCGRMRGITFVVIQIAMQMALRTRALT